MVDRKLLRQFDLPDEDLRTEFAQIFRTEPGDFDPEWLPDAETTFEVNKIVNGRVLNVVGDEVWIDVGYKSEGVIPLQEWYDEGEDKIKPPQPGDQVKVLLDAIEDESGAIVLSYRKAKRQEEWETIINKHR